MHRLANDWLTQGLIDFEYKKYILLAYLKTVNESFTRSELYPCLGDLVFHYRNILSVRENKTLLKEAFPKEISREDFKKLELSYKQIVQDDAIMAELEAIMDYSLPRIKERIEEGSAIYEYVESQCEISTIGVTPLYAREGYLFVSQPPEKETDVYRYQVSIFDSQEQLQSLNTQFIEHVPKKSFYTYESIKLDLVKKFRDLPNPATYLLVSKMKFPPVQTLLPVARRLLVRQILSA